MQTSTRPRKILYVITKGSWGGAGKYVETLAKHASCEHDFEVCVLTGSKGELTRRLEEAHVKTYTCSIENSLHPMRLYTEVSHLLSFLKEHSPHIVHSNSNKAGIVAAIAVTIHNVVTRTRIHSLFTIHGHAFNEARGFFSKCYITLGELLIFCLVDTIICVSKKVYEDIPFSSLFARKSSIIYNGLPTMLFHDKETAREKLSITDHSIPHFVTIAELNDNKNHVYLLRELTTYTQPYKYHIIGTGTHERIIRNFIATHKLDDRVILHGHIEDAAAYLKAFDLFILPSKTEALAYVIQEAGQAGIKTIAAHVGGIPEMLPQSLLFSLNKSSELQTLLNSMEALPVHTTYFKEEDMLAQTFALYRNVP